MAGMHGTWAADGMAGACRGLLQEGTAGYGRGSIGGPFFLSMFVVFDQATPAIRFASQA